MKFTTRGRITLLRDGVAISTHVLAEEAYERAYAHALANGPGKYTVRYPDREVDLSTLTRIVLEAAPTGISATPASASAINLAWTANPRAASYRVYRNGTLVGSPTGVTYSDTGLSASTAYTYTVSTVSASTGEGPVSAGVVGTTLAAPDTTAPTAPTITATATGQNTVSVALTTPATDAQSGVANYDLEYKTAAASTYSVITPVTAGQFPYVIGSLSAGTQYNHRARARDVAGNVGAYSVVSNATTNTGTGGAYTAGWTDLDALIMSAPYASARILYVSTSGNDATAQTYTQASAALGGVPTNPTGAIQPYATLAAAYAQMRTGFPDVLLLKRGDTWSTSIEFNKSGASASGRQIYAAYGSTSTARPIAESIIVRFGNASVTHVLIAHIDFLMTLDTDWSGTTIRYEGCRFRHMTNGQLRGIAIASDFSQLFRCQFRNVNIYAGYNYPTGAVPNGLQIEESGFYGHPSLPSPVTTHNVYLNVDSINGVSRHNVSATSPGTGWRQRGFGVVEGIVVLKNRAYSSFDFGFQSSPPTGPISSSFTCRYNTVVDSGNGGMALYNVYDATIEQNLIVNGDAYYSESSGWVAENVTYQDNIIYNGKFMPYSFPSPNITGPWLIRRNDFQRSDTGVMFSAPVSTGFTYENNNRFYSAAATTSWFDFGVYADWVPSRGSNTQVSYTAPGRNCKTYMESLGASPATDDEAIDWFMNGVPGNPSLAGMLANRLGAWDDRFTAKAINNHIRAGFGMAAIP